MVKKNGPVKFARRLMSDDPIDRLTVEEAKERLRKIREVLFPAVNPDEEWSCETIDWVAEHVSDLLGPGREEAVR